MPDLAFRVDTAKMVPFSASPLLALDLEITNEPTAEAIHAIMLQCQVRIDAVQRAYGPEERERLGEVFGTPDMWTRSLKGLLWTQTTVLVPRFTARTVVQVSLPCSIDFNAATAKYFYGLGGGDVPLILLFSGTVLHAGPDGQLSAAQIAWTKETPFRLPLKVYKETLEHYHPNCELVSLRRDVFDRLYRYRRSAGLHSWEDALESLLPADGATS